MTQHKTPSAQRLLTLALALTLPALSAAHAAAQECAQDADCASGDRCEFVVSRGACGVDDQGTVTCEEPDETPLGFCYTPPTPCMSDAECGPFTECLLGLIGGDVTVSVDCAEGDEGCGALEAPAPEAPPAEGYCAPRQTSCAANSDCPSDFHCEIFTYEVGCARPAAPCAEGEDCPEQPPVDDCADLEPVTEGICLPNEIDCAGGAACPADWRCVEIESVSCSGGAIEGGAPRDSAPQPSEGGAGSAEGGAPEAPLPTEECVSATRSLCVPEGWEQGVGFANAPGGVESQGALGDLAGQPGEAFESEEGTPRASGARDANAASDVEEGGCDAAGGRGASHLSLIALALAGLAALRRRARLER